MTDWLQGLFVPVTTNFDPVTGDIAPVAFRENLRRWLQTPIDGYVVFGSTGEGALLDEDEMARLLEYARDVIPPQRPLVAGAGGESTRAVIRMAKRFGAAGCLPKAGYRHPGPTLWFPSGPWPHPFESSAPSRWKT